MQLLHLKLLVGALKLEIQNINILFDLLLHPWQKNNITKAKIENILTHYYVKTQAYTKVEKGVK